MIARLRGGAVRGTAATAILTVAVAALVAPTARAASPTLSLSGTVVNVSGEQTVDGVTTLPANPPPVAGAVIRVDGTEVTSTNGSGAFSFNYTGTDDAVTVSATASGLGTWQLTNVSSTASGDVLTMMLNGHNTSRDVSPPATASGGTNTTAPIPATAPPEGSTTTTTPPPTTTGGGSTTPTTTPTPTTAGGSTTTPTPTTTPMPTPTPTPTTGGGSTTTTSPTPAASPNVQTPAASPSVSGNCGGYSSNTAPPPTINVLEYGQHTSTGAAVAGTELGVFQVPFETYVENVLASEWVPSWQPDSLDAGAMAVKSYAWYFVNNWPRQGSYNGACYNVDDSTNYQRFVPGVTFASTTAAVVATWDTIMTNGGQIVEASYQATLTGNTDEACGAGLSNFPGVMSAWGSQNCRAGWRHMATDPVHLLSGRAAEHHRAAGDPVLYRFVGHVAPDRRCGLVDGRLDRRHQLYVVGKSRHSWPPDEHHQHDRWGDDDGNPPGERRYSRGLVPVHRDGNRIGGQRVGANHRVGGAHADRPQLGLLGGGLRRRHLHLR